MKIQLSRLYFEGNVLRVIQAKATRIKGVSNQKPYDYDLYEIEARSSLATREFSLVVDIIKQEVSGDVIAFGSWYDLDQSSVIEILKQLKEENQLLRTVDFL